MKSIAALLLILAPAYDFENGEAGKPPAGFSAVLSGKGAEGAWEIREEAGAPSGKKVLAQTSTDDTSGRYPLCILDGFTGRDVAVSVKFKALSGEVDQAGGVVLRYQDKDNYYIARANALEGNVRLYKMEEGKRKQFFGVEVTVAPGEWHALKLEAVGSHFKVWFDGKFLFEADDETFKEPGKTGLWTKADSVTLFDDFAANEAGN